MSTSTRENDIVPVTVALASACGLDVSGDDLACVAGTITPRITEWSINPAALAGPEPRGCLRFGAWTDERDQIAACLAGLGADLLIALHQQVAGSGMEAVGLGFGAQGRPSRRWWKLGRHGDGEAIAQAALEREPELAHAYDFLVRVTGHPERCVAIGAESRAGDDGDQLGRLTLYFELLQPGAALAVLEHIGCAPTRAANAFFRGVLGLGDAERSPAWPKVWVGRSQGRGGGWKFYYFARGDITRAPDGDMLALIGAPRPVYNAHTRMTGILGAHDHALVQILGLGYHDGAAPDAEPAWTVYLAHDDSAVPVSRTRTDDESAILQAVNPFSSPIIPERE